jgi:HK97 family phage portal protein
MWKWLQLKAAMTVARALGLTDPRLYQYFTGGPSYAGETVTVDTAMRIDTVYSCVKLISSTIATLPLQTFQMMPDGRGQLARDHWGYQLLHDRPNADMTAVTFLTAMFACLLLWGNAYAEIERRSDGTVISLTPLYPAFLTLHPQPDGSLLYVYSFRGQTLKYTEDQIFHLKGFSLDGIIGLSPIAQAREALGIAMAAEKSAASFYKNSMRPSLVLTAPAYLNDTQRARFGDSFVEKFSGSINAGKVPLVEGNWKIDQISMNPEDAQLLTTRAYSVEQICRFYGVSPVMVGHMEKTTAWGTGLEQMNLWFLTYTLRPLLRTFEQEVWRSLFRPVDRLLYYVEFDVEGLLRTDSEKRAQTLRNLVDGSIMTADEARAAWSTSLGPLPGGDKLTAAAGRMPLDTLGQQPAAPAEPPVPDRQQGNVVRMQQRAQ